MSERATVVPQLIVMHEGTRILSDARWEACTRCCHTMYLKYVMSHHWPVSRARSLSHLSHRPHARIARQFCESEEALHDKSAFHLYFKLREVNRWRQQMPHVCEEEVEELPLSKMFYSNTVRWLNDTLTQTNKVLIAIRLHVSSLSRSLARSLAALSPRTRLPNNSGSRNVA